MSESEAKTAAINERPPGSPQRRSRTRDMAAAGLIVALLAVSAYVQIPLGAVPFTLQTFVVVLAALLLSPGWSAASIGLYLAIGAAGVPVFSGGRGGLGVLAGPTGGYLIGFLVGATLGSAVRVALGTRGAKPVVADGVAALTVVGVVYLVGAAQLALVAGLTPSQAIVAGVVPFVGLDAVKALAAVAVAAAVRRARGA